MKEFEGSGSPGSYVYEYAQKKLFVAVIFSFFGHFFYVHFGANDPLAFTNILSVLHRAIVAKSVL